MFSKPLIQFSVDGWSGVPSLLFTWNQTKMEVMKIMATSFKRSHACTATLSTPNPAASHHCPTPLLETWTLLGKSDSVSSGVTAPFSWVLVHIKFCCVLQESTSPVLCKFWQLYAGVDGDFLQEDLCYTQVCCTQSPCPCSSPLLTCTSTGNAQSSVSVSVRSLGPGMHKVCLSPLSISARKGI